MGTHGDLSGYEVCHTQTQVWSVQVWYECVLLWLYVQLSFVFKR